MQRDLFAECNALMEQGDLLAARDLAKREHEKWFKLKRTTRDAYNKSIQKPVSDQDIDEHLEHIKDQLETTIKYLYETGDHGNNRILLEPYDRSITYEMVRPRVQKLLTSYKTRLLEDNLNLSWYNSINSFDTHKQSTCILTLSSIKPPLSCFKD